jgi:hypothetical protein
VNSAVNKFIRGKYTIQWGDEKPVKSTAIGFGADPNGSYIMARPHIRYGNDYIRLRWLDTGTKWSIRREV